MCRDHLRRDTPEFAKRLPEGECFAPLGKNTGRPNEFTDSEHFRSEHNFRRKSILAMTLAERPGTGITLRQNRSTSHVITCDTSATNNEIRVSEENSLKIIASDLTSVNIS